MFLLLCFLFSGLVPLRAHATTGSDYHGEDLYRWTIYWHVDNSYDVSSNKLVINTYHGNTEFDWYDGHPYRVDEMYDGTRAEFDHPSYEIPYMASSQVDHTTTIDTGSGSPPLGIQYRIAGKGGNNCRWYLDKVEVEVIDPVKGTGLPAKRTLWKGCIGARNGHVSGSVNYCDLWFDKKPPELTSWANSTTTGEAKHTDTYDAVFCEHPHIEGITPLSVDKPANVPEDGNDLSVEMNVGIIYDYLGAIWPLQKFDITCDQSDKNIKIDHRDGKWYLVLPPDSNASEDYDVTINQQVYEEEDFHTSTKVTVHTFDYHFTFVDENGNVISEQTVDYGDQVSIPENPEGQSARYVCDQIADWENTTTGPKDRTVKVYHITDSTYNGKLNFNNGGGFVGRDTGNYYTDGPDCVHIELCLFAPQAGSSYDRADPFAFFSHGRVLTSYYTAEWRDYDPYAPVMHGVPLQLWKVPGQGTETDPKILSGYGAYGWDTLRCITERESTHGIYFRQDSDMKVFSSVGDDNHYFEGVFDGNGKTLEACFKYNGVNSVAAPFGRINNATIKGVTVTGQIHAAHCAGLVFNCSGDSKIDQCEIHADIKGGDLTGGYVSKTIGTLTITNSTFEGTINGGSQCGGFVARGSAFTSILRSIFMPSGSSACKSGSTFVEGNFWKITDCHYTVPFGNAQGRPIDHSSPDPDNNGDYKAMLQVVKLISKLPDPTSMTLVDKEKVQVRSSQRRRQRPASSPKKRQIRRPLRKPSRSLRKARHITSGFELIIS